MPLPSALRRARPRTRSLVRSLVHAAFVTLAGSALAAGLLAPARAAHAQRHPPGPGNPFIGTWQGTLDVGPAKLRLGVLVRDSAGTLVGTLTSIDQGNTRLPAAVTSRGDTLRLAVAAVGAEFRGVLAAGRDSVRGTFRQGGGDLPLALGRVGALATEARARPQDPKPPFPYRAEEVTFASAPGVRLAGTLVVPEGAGPHPAVVLVSGSGPQDRDESLMGHRPFLVLADHLARHGIASLRYDDRGTAASTGDHAGATSVDFADDAEAAVRLLRTRPGIAADRVGIVGHSEGGLIAPMVAARTRDVAFVVLLAGPGLRGDSILALQNRLILRAQGLPDEAVAQATAVNRRLVAAVAGARDLAEAGARFDSTVRAVVEEQPAPARPSATAALAQARGRIVSPWMHHFVTHDPRPALERVRVPVLALNGTLDLQVPATENLQTIGAALAAGGNRDHTELALPGLNHLFQTARTGAPGEYQQIEETMAPAALDAITAWIRQRFVQ